MSLKELADKDIISREFECIREDIHYERPLYYHQQKAVEKLSGEDKNIIVATGTGSGKTECYMLPFFNYLMREKEAGKLGPGVRALLLFPMNALANDQVKKLRQLLANYPDITFGRYTGETERTDLHDSLNSSSVILLRANNIDDGKINFDDVVYVDKSKVSQDQYLKKGYILIWASS